MTSAPSTIQEAVSATGDVFRAGGTDLTETRKYGASQGDIIDLMNVEALRGIEWGEDGGVRIGAMTTMANLLSDERLGAAYPGLMKTTANIAAPHIRAVGTIGGNLLQSTRCWYFRNEAFQCFKKGGDGCPSRDGNHLFGVCFDLGPCVAPHPSTLGMALLAYDAEFEVHGDAPQPIADLYGDGSDPTRDHLLGSGDLLEAVRIPPPLAGERSAYIRANARAVAEWPLVEVLVRRSAAGAAEPYARVAIGGVATVPLRLGSLERVLVEAPNDPERLERAVDAIVDASAPGRMTRFKLPILRGALLDALHGAMG